MLLVNLEAFANLRSSQVCYKVLQWENEIKNVLPNGH